MLDASAAVLGLLNHGDARVHMANEPLVTPHLADSEIAHALRSQVLRGRIDQVVASTALATWSHLGVSRYPVTDLLGRVWDLRHNLSAYDACYVALAEAMGVSILSADARLVATAKHLRCGLVVVGS